MPNDQDPRHLAVTHDAGFVAAAPALPGLAISLLSAIPDCVKLLDPEGRLRSMSHAGLCLMEIDDFSEVKGQPWWDLWPPEGAETLRRAVEAARQGGPSRFTAFCPTAKGTPKWWDVSVTPILGLEGEVSGVLSVSRDVSDHVEARRQVEAALEHTQLLLREIDHRVKNSLMLIVGLLRMQVRQVGDSAAAQALTEAAQRVRTVARVHDRLYRADRPDRVGLQDYLSQLCLDLDAAFREEERPAIATDIAPLWVSPDRAVALGLVAAELVANAYRHARLRSDGRVSVSLALEGPDRARLVVADDGQGLPGDFSPEGVQSMGMRVILAKVEELGGELTWEARPEGGTAFALAFPLG